MSYPRHVYKSPGPYAFKKLTYAVCTVESDEELADKLKVGWFETRADAFSPPKIDVVPAQVPADDAPVTREELEQKANDLGIKFDGRTPDKTLMAKIAKALKV